VRAAKWTVIATGMYLRSVPTDDHDAMHAQRAVAAAQRIPGAIIIGASAAAVHKLPLVHPLPQHVELSVPHGSWRGIRGSIRRRYLDITSADLVDGPVFLTSVARTVVDVARERPLADALSVGDAAVRRHLVTHDDIAFALQRAAPIKGLRHAPPALRTLTLVASLLSNRGRQHNSSNGEFHFQKYKSPSTTNSDSSSHELISSGVSLAWSEKPMA